MIHQFIFAGPKPGLSSAAFKSYWINFHSIDYAAKIPQIRQYLVAERLYLVAEPTLPFFEGVAEIWLKDSADQIASLQSPEFLEGARRDEPRWAAFWQTLVLETDEYLLKDLVAPQPWPEFVKLYILLKRYPGLSLETFRKELLEDRKRLGGTAGLERHLVGFARPELYGLGEPRFDAIEVLSFRESELIDNFLNDTAKTSSTGGTSSTRPYLDSRYIFNFVGREHWIIRPDER
jgi:hypothetical protein